MSIIEVDNRDDEGVVARERECDERDVDEDHKYPAVGTEQVLYVNVYRVTRHYGGPEEGGWWYDAGEPLASVPIAGVWVQQFEDVPGVHHLIPAVSLDFLR